MSEITDKFIAASLRKTTTTYASFANISVEKADKRADVFVVASRRAALESDSDDYYYYEHETVTPLDVVLVLRHSVGKTTLDDNQQIVGDVDGSWKSEP